MVYLYIYTFTFNIVTSIYRFTLVISKVVTRQYRSIVDRASKSAASLSVPPEGWIRSARKALNMSGAQLARRMGVSRMQVSQTEKKETSGAVTLKTIDNMARAMGCRLVYAIVPDRPLEELVSAQARKKATALIGNANTQMALEDQRLSTDDINYEIDRLAREISERLPSDLWDDA